MRSLIFLPYLTERFLFRHAVSQVRERGAAAIELDADPHAVPFYERMGCRLIGQSWTDWERFVPRMRCEEGLS